MIEYFWIRPLRGSSGGFIIAVALAPRYRLAQDEFDLSIDAAQLVGCPHNQSRTGKEDDQIYKEHRSPIDGADLFSPMLADLMDSVD